MRISKAVTLAVIGVPVSALVALAEGAKCPPDYGYCGFTLPLPAQWGTLAAACGEGTTQSPVVLKATRRQRGEGLRFDYRRSTLRLANSGHDFRAEIPEGVDDLLFVPGAGEEGYRLQQFHFHVPREHQLRATRDVVGELHLVHDRGGHHVVVALFVRLGDENRALDPVFRKLPLALCQGEEIDFDPSRLLATARGSYFAYTGSLTTPPCTEGVDFYVFPRPITIGRAQLDKLIKFGPNARPVQRNANPIRYVRVPRGRGW